MLVLLVPVLLICACVKAKARKVDKTERREELRASRTSLRASRASLAASRQSLASIGKPTDDIRMQKKRRAPLGRNDGMDVSGISADDSSFDPMEKKRLMKDTYTLDSRYNASSTLTAGKPEFSTYLDSDLSGNTDFDRPQNVENEIAAMRSRPTLQSLRSYDETEQYDSRYADEIEQDDTSPPITPVRIEEPKRYPPYAQRYKNGNNRQPSSSSASSSARQRDRDIFS